MPLISHIVQNNLTQEGTSPQHIIFSAAGNIQLPDQHKRMFSSKTALLSLFPVT